MLVSSGAFAAQMVESLEASLSDSSGSNKKKQKRIPSADIKIIWANNRRMYSMHCSSFFYFT